MTNEEKNENDIELTPTEREWDEEADDLRVKSVGWKELWLKEDWWAIWVGLGIVIVAVAFFLNGGSIKWIAIKPAKWDTLGQAFSHFGAHISQYLAMFVMWLVIFVVAVKAMGYKLSEYIPSFIFVFIFSVIIFMVGAWDQAHHYNLEPPLVALLLGMLISNLIGLPRWMDTGFRVEFYIKIGIVLLGATLPFTLIVWAGPVAIVQASIVSITTFLVIYFTAKKLGLDRRLGATLGAGGAVCGVSGAIAIAGAVGAKKEHAPIAITMVILWAIVMIFFLPLVSRALGLHAGIAGAWVGTSEFADAAGFAAAQAYGNLAENLPKIPGTQDDAVWATIRRPSNGCATQWARRTCVTTPTPSWWRTSPGWSSSSTTCRISPTSTRNTTRPSGSTSSARPGARCRTGPMNSPSRAS